MRNVAPEITTGEAHDLAVDVWALGQIAYQLLCCPGSENILTCQTIDNTTGEAIPRHNQLLELKTTAGNLYWQNGNGVSESYKDLIALMVMPEPRFRPTMSRIVKYPAFNQH